MRVSAAKRARIAVFTRVCLGDAWLGAEAVAAWVDAGDCADEQNLRILCLELVAQHLRSGSMTLDLLQQRMEELHRFATRPDTPRIPAAPVTRRESSAGDRRRTA